MSDDKIDLGVSQKDLGCCQPVEISSSPSEKERIEYPAFHYSGPVDLDLPENFEATVCLKKISETSRVKSDGKHWYECCIEVHSLEDVEDQDEVKQPTSRNNDAETALDTLAKAIMQKRGGGDDEDGDY